jgi:hypothetical protein
VERSDTPSIAIREVDGFREGLNPSYALIAFTAYSSVPLQQMEMQKGECTMTSLFL